jgi:threonine aldolase
VPLKTIAAPFDSVSVCLSKGLGAPIGSVVAGSKSFITAAHRFRKMFGGGMRQVGVLAAAGIYALDHHLARLAEDHQNLRRLVEGIARIGRGLECDPEAFPTNIAYVKSAELSGVELAARLKSYGVLANASGPNEIRVVTHLDVPTAAIDEAINRFERAV